MELKQFITETLVQITQGVSAAQELVKDSGAFINPQGYHEGGHVKTGTDAGYRKLQNVKMSVAVNVSENIENKAGIVGLISVFSFGTSTKNLDVNSVVNRIEFEIPISLPIMKT